MFHTVTALCGYLGRINSTKFKLRTLSRNLDFTLPVSTRSVRNMPYRALRNVSYRALLDTHKVFWFQFWGSRRILFSPFSFFWVFSLNFFRWQNLCLCVWVFFSRAESRRSVSFTLSLFPIFSLFSQSNETDMFLFMISLFWVRDFPTPKFKFVAIDLITPFHTLHIHTQLYFFVWIWVEREQESQREGEDTDICLRRGWWLSTACEKDDRLIWSRVFWHNAKTNMTPYYSLT